MRETDYAYAVARIRTHEARLLTRHDIDRLLAAPTEADCLRILVDRGYPAAENGDAMLAAETTQAWALLRELAPNLSVFDVLLCRNDFHNVKAAIKGIVTNQDCTRLFLPEGCVPTETIRKAVTSRDFSLLPPNMRAAAEEALTVLLETGDGQLTDVILDAAQLRAMLEAGKEKAAL
jgi:V/A-type H+-transporting ATPase subunit C